MSDAYRDAWIAEMWKPVREISREERMAQRVVDEASQIRSEELTAQPVEKALHRPEKGAA